MEKSSSIFKGLGYAYIITLAALLIYNLLLTFTNISGSSIAMATASITTVSSAFGGFYASKNIKEKGILDFPVPSRFKESFISVSAVFLCKVTVLIILLL